VSEPTVCIKALRAPFFTAVARTGKPLAELAAKVDIPFAALTDTTARIPHSAAIRAWETFAEMCDEPSFGLVAAEFAGAAPLDLVDFALFRAPTLRALVASFLRYQRLFHDANAAELVEASGRAALRHAFRGDLARSRHLTEFIFAMWTLRAKHIARILDAPPSVTFRHGPPPDPGRARTLFGEGVRWGAEHDEIGIRPEALDVALPHGDETAAETLARQLDQELAKLTPKTLAERVRAHAVAGIKRGHLDLDAIAKALAHSRRTLQRRLGEEGTSFREVIDDARKEVALETIARGATTVTDLTFVLGFSDLSAFGRAFRRWTGKNPAAYLRDRG